MAKKSHDEVIEKFRERRLLAIQAHARHAAEKIIAALPRSLAIQIDPAGIAAIITEEFSQGKI